MRFSIEYTDAKTKQFYKESISLLETFLNYHLIGNFHGWSYECLFIKLIANAPQKKKWKLRRAYEMWGQIELPIDFQNKDVVQEFYEAYDVVIQAVQLINTLEIKGIKDFDAQQLLDDLHAFKQKAPRSNDEFTSLSNERLGMQAESHIRRVDGLIRAYKLYPSPHTRYLAGARIYDHFETNELMPYRYMFAEILSTLLRNQKISTPGYQEIYFSVDKTLEGAKYSMATEKWHRYTYCSIDIDKYRSASNEEKENMLLDSLIEGLQLITDFDHLDKQKIDEVIALVRIAKCRTPLTFSIKENELYRVSINYEIGPNPAEKTPFYITIKNKSTNRESTQLIDHFDILWAAYSLRKIEILKDRVEIVGSGGLTGAISREVAQVSDSYSVKLP